MLVVIEPAAARRPGGMALVVAAQPDDRHVDRVVGTALRVAVAGEGSRKPDGSGSSFRNEQAPVDHQGLLGDGDRINSRTPTPNFQGVPLEASGPSKNQHAGWSDFRPVVRPAFFGSWRWKLGVIDSRSLLLLHRPAPG